MQTDRFFIVSLTLLKIRKHSDFYLSLFSRDFTGIIKLIKKISSKVWGFLSIYFEHFVSSRGDIKTSKTKETQNRLRLITKVKESTMKTFYFQRKNDQETGSLNRGTCHCSMHSGKLFGFNTKSMSLRS